jgi:CRISPR-associated protein Csm3
VLSEEQEIALRSHGASQVTEIKYENSIDRVKAEANPRQVERVIRGSEFGFELIYEATATATPEEISEDIETLVTGLTLLTYDYLGGHGTRGYGRVSFRDAHAEVVVGHLDANLLDDLNRRLGSLRGE